MGVRLGKFVAVLLCGIIFGPLFAVLIGRITLPVVLSWGHDYIPPDFLTGVVPAGYSLGGLLGLLLTYLLFKTLMDLEPGKSI